MARILKFNSDKAEELIARMKADIEEIDRHLANIVEYNGGLVPHAEREIRQSLPAPYRITQLRHHRLYKVVKPMKNCTSTAKRVSSVPA